MEIILVHPLFCFREEESQDEDHGVPVDEDHDVPVDEDHDVPDYEFAANR